MTDITQDRADYFANMHKPSDAGFHAFVADGMPEGTLQFWAVTAATYNSADGIRDGVTAPSKFDVDDFASLHQKNLSSNTIQHSDEENPHADEVRPESD